MIVDMFPADRRTGASSSTAAARHDLTQTYFYRSCYLIGIIAYADFANILSVSSFGFETSVKYAYFIFIFSIYASIFFTTPRINMGLDGPTIFLMFTLLATTALALQIVRPGQNSSYAGAFLATLLVSAAGIFDLSRHGIEPLGLARRIQSLLLILSFLYVLELTIRSVSGLAYFEDVLNQTIHIKSFVLVASIGLGILLRDRTRLFLAVLLLVASEILRPSSSLIAAVLVIAPVAFMISRNRMRAARTMTYGIVLGAAAIPVALYLSDDLKTLITDIETWTKQDLLQGQSNTFFRLAIQDLAIDRLQETSIMFGAMFTASSSVQLSNKLSWWAQNSPDGLAAIHSDYVSLLCQSGVVGYLFYNLALLLICRFLFSGISAARAQGRPYALMGLAICCVVLVIFYSSANPFLQYYTISHVAWFIVALGYINARLLRSGDARGFGRAADASKGMARQAART